MTTSIFCIRIGNNTGTVKNWKVLKTTSPLLEVVKYYSSPLSSPLHKNLQHPPLNAQAVSMSKSIHQYMHDKGAKMNVRGIFQAALENVSLRSDPFYRFTTLWLREILQKLLRDELYCQLMKQVTQNPKKEVEKRGWELLWLSAGLFPCSNELLEVNTTLFVAKLILQDIINHTWIFFQDLRQFLSTRPKIVCQETLYRLERTLELGARKRLPHWIEVEAIQDSLPLIHRVCFNNDMEYVSIILVNWISHHKLIDVILFVYLYFYIMGDLFFSSSL